MLKAKLHILVMAGGTGGHIYPALAVAEELISRGHKVSWLGSEGGMEQSLVDNRHIQMHLLPVKGVRGKGKIALLKAPFTLFWCVMKAMQIIRRSRINLVIGFGGFASGPGGIAAFISGRKLVLHEQNAIPGLTNRVLSRMASLVCEAFPGAFEKSSSVVTTGNPIRKAIVDLNQSKNETLVGKTESNDRQNQGSEHLNVLIIGGSRGAQVFNQQMPKLFSKFNEATHLSVIHQTGKGNLNSVTSLYDEQEVSVNYKVNEFIHDMAANYLWADVIVCRAGALTVSEVAAVGLPAVFVPYPFAVDDHQTKNAQFLTDLDAAVIVPQHKLEELMTYLNEWLKNKDKLTEMAKRAKQHAVLNATEVICDQCETLISREAA